MGKRGRRGRQIRTEAEAQREADKLIGEVATDRGISDEQASSEVLAVVKLIGDLEAGVTEVTDSPIERTMLRAMALEAMRRSFGSIAFGRMPAAGDGPCFELDTSRSGRLNLRVFTQMPAGIYRIDMLVMLHDHDEQQIGPAVVVECDGHDFHEKTKEQAARDKRRDRFLATRRNTVVLHFTGSEIHNGSAACAVEVLDVLMRDLPP